MKSKYVFLVAATLLLAVSSSVNAQQLGPRIPPQYGPGLRPGLSPYLNLLRGGDTASNYYLGVRTEFQRRDDRVNLLTRTRELEDRTAQIENQDENQIEGTPSDFGDTRAYFAAPNTYYGRVTPGNINQGRPASRQHSIR
jgi:hypothetical protein